MKRSVKILLAILMVSLLVLSLSACQDPCADGHLYTPGEITKQPTCTSEGERTYTCSRCGQTFTQSIGKLPHSLQTLEGKPATCADAGLTSSFKCSVCGEVIPPQEAIPMLPAHTWDNGTVTTEPKCKDGEITFKCTVCGATRTEQLVARHNYDNGVLTIAPTCGDYGQRVYTCKDCGATYQVLVAPMADQHVFGPWVEETDQHVGYFQCQNCGKYFDADGNELPSVNKGEQLPVWKLVTSDSTPIALGDRIVIVASTADMAMCTTQKTNNRDGVAITRDAATQTIVITSEVQIITIEAGTKNGTFALAVGTGQYLRGAGTTQSTLKTAKQVDDESSWTIEVSADGIATVKSQGTNARNWLRYNSTGSNHLFNCYESGQDDIQIYRYTGSGEIVIPGEHECQHQCPTCGKCTSDCDDPACAEKCPGHESADDKGKTQDNPLTVEEAIALMKEAGSGVVVGAAEKQQYYVKGVVSGSTVDTQFHEWTFTLGTGSEKATCQAKINSSVSVEFPESDGALDGATVIIHGFLELFNGQYKIAYLPASASPTGDKFTPDVVEVVLPADAHFCQHVCPQCGLCTDETCDNAKCQPKCAGHSAVDPDKGKTKENPLTVEEAIALMNEAGSGKVVGAAEKQQYYVQGVVNAGSTRNTYGQWEFKLGDGSTKITCQVNVDASVTNIRSNEAGALDGATVIVHGFLELFNGTYQISYLPASASPTGAKFNPTLVEVVYPAGVHYCQHVCPIDGKCLDPACGDPACADKCDKHQNVQVLEITPTNIGSSIAGLEKSGVAKNASYSNEFTFSKSTSYIKSKTLGKVYAIIADVFGTYDNMKMYSAYSVDASKLVTATKGSGQGTLYIYDFGDGTTEFYFANTSTYTVNMYSIKIYYEVCQHTNRTEHPLKEATCTEDGNIQYWSCNNCGKLFNAATGGDIIEQSTTVLKAGHKYSEEVAQLPAECEKDGVKAHYTCTVCNKKFVKQGELYVEQSDEQLKIPQLGHDFEGQDWVQSDDGKHYKQCVRFETCGGKDGEEQCNTAAWEQTDKTHQKKCSDCGRLSGEPEGHTFDATHKCKCGYSQHAAQVGEEYFTDLASALNKALTLSGEQTITLLANNTGAGLRFTEHTGKITIDLGTFTYTVNAAVGSAGTESQALQVLPGAEVEIKGGTIAAESGKGVVRLVNNYGNLTLNGVTLDATNVEAGCDAAVVAYSGELTLTNVTFNAVPATAYALSATYWSKYSGVTVTVDELTDFATGNKGVEIDLDTLKGETSPTGAEVTVTFTKEQRTEGADNYTIKVLGSNCDKLTKVTFKGTKISHNYAKKSGEESAKHVCAICGDEGEHKWVYDATGTKNDTQHTVKCEGCGETKLVDHTYDQDGNKCVCGQAEPAQKVVDTIVLTPTSLGLPSSYGSSSSNKSVASSVKTKSVTFSYIQTMYSSYSKSPQYIQMKKNAGIINNTTAFPGRIVKIELATPSVAQGDPGAVTLTFGTSSSPTGNSKAVSFSGKGDTQTITCEDGTNYTYFELKNGSGTGYIDKITIYFEVDD